MHPRETIRALLDKNCSTTLHRKMSKMPETTFELPFSFGEGFMEDHAGHIISDPRIALVELIANAYDAGATKVDLRWPAEIGQPFVLTDNGTGMSRPEFERRWKTLCYNRQHEQGLNAENPNRIPGKKRVAFGYSGKGRQARFVSPIFTSSKRGKMACPFTHESK